MVMDTSPSQRVERFEQLAEAVFRCTRLIADDDRRGPAHNDHVGAERTDRGWKKVHTAPQLIEHISDHGGIKIFADSCEQLGV